MPSPLNLFPCSFSKSWVLCLNIDLSQFAAKDGLRVSIILSLKKLLGLCLVFSPKAYPDSGRAILSVIGATSAI